MRFLFATLLLTTTVVSVRRIGFSSGRLLQVWPTLTFHTPVLQVNLAQNEMRSFRNRSAEHFNVFFGLSLARTEVCKKFQNFKNRDFSLNIIFGRFKNFQIFWNFQIFLKLFRFLKIFRFFFKISQKINEIQNKIKSELNKSFNLTDYTSTLIGRRSRIFWDSNCICFRKSLWQFKL